MRKYIEIFRYALKVNMTFIFDYFFSTISYAIHMFVFSMLWDYILKDGSAFGYNKTELIWYIVVAEFITYGIASYYKKISDMVKDGTIANMLLKPMNILTYFFVEQSANVPKIIINFIAGIIIGIIMTDGKISTLNITATSFTLFIIACILSFIIGTLIQILIGVISFFMEEVRSLNFIIQKIQLLLVFVPLEFYNSVVQKILLIFPTTYMIYAPAKILVKYELNSSLALIGMQLISIILLMLATTVVYKKGVEKINVNGG